MTVVEDMRDMGRSSAFAARIASDSPEPAVTVRPAASAAEWDGYVAAHAAASRYHLSGWASVIARSFGHDVRQLVAESSHGIVGVLPLVLFKSAVFGRSAVSMPFLNYGGVVADSAEAERALLAAGIEEARRAGASHLELRHSERKFPELVSRRHKVAMILELRPAPDAQWQALDRKVRNQVRKAEKHGLTVRSGGPELLDCFYSVFARNMRDLGTPVYARRFFEEILSAFPDNTRVFGVFLGDRAAAASIVYWQHDAIEVPWASAHRDFNHLCPNTLLYWEMLRYAAAQGFRRFDFGRSSRDAGTFHFKQQWGAEPHDLVWEYWTAANTVAPDLSPANPKFKYAIELWKRLPLPVATALGPYLVRNIP